MIQEPLYLQSYSAAERANELDLFYISLGYNIACALQIDTMIRFLSPDGVLNRSTGKSIVDEFGFDRVNHVLANSIHHRQKEKGITPGNKDWAKQILPPSGRDGFDFKSQYIAKGKPSLLNALVEQVKTAYEELHLFDKSHCEPDSSNMDYEGHVLVINPSIFRDEYKHPDQQLFIADLGGFGCTPGLSGRKVMGHFLIDGTNGTYYRQNFLGILKNEFLPDWAAKKLSSQAEPESVKEPTM